jgi:paraquat-inducible protein A
MPTDGRQRSAALPQLPCNTLAASRALAARCAVTWAWTQSRTLYRSMQEVPDVIACEGCDALYTRPDLRPGEIARCLRCQTELERHPGSQHDRILPLTLACLVLFAIANLFPIVAIEINGAGSRTTLLGAVATLVVEGRALVAALVLATTFLFPLVQLGALFYLLFPRPDPGPPAGFDWLVRSIQSLRPWGMIEVFLLGVLVAIVKLSSMAVVVPGPALWSYVALTLLLTAVLSFDPRLLWDGSSTSERRHVDCDSAAAAR